MNKFRSCIAVASALILLTGCSDATSYKIYYGKMLTSSGTMKYSDISEKEIDNHLGTEETIVTDEYGEYVYEVFYYCNLYFLKTEDDLDVFSNTSKINVPVSELTTVSSDFDNYFYIYFFAQIPAGYQAYKRENIQTTDTSGTTVLITPSFFSYANRTQIAYCFIDVEEDETVEDDYVFAFYYQVEREYEEELTVDTVRVVLDTED